MSRKDPGLGWQHNNWIKDPEKLFRIIDLQICTGSEQNIYRSIITLSLTQ
jgi:hypothetical protein